MMEIIFMTTFFYMTTAAKAEKVKACEAPVFICACRQIPRRVNFRRG
jgi:hypothetical protein